MIQKEMNQKVQTYAQWNENVGLKAIKTARKWVDVKINWVIQKRNYINDDKLKENYKTFLKDNRLILKLQ